MSEPIQPGRPQETVVTGSRMARLFDLRYVIAGLLGLIWPSPQPWSTLLVAGIALTVQVVSPWDHEAAFATRYDRRRRAA